MKHTKKRILQTRFWSTPIRFFVAITALFLILIIPFTVYYENQQTQIKSNAAASTNLSFSQSTVQVSAGNPISLSIVMNPGSNSVSLVQLVILYDSSMITPDPSTGIQPNTAVFPTTLDGPTYGTCNGNQCTMSIYLSVGSDATKAVTQQATIATVNFTPVKQGTTQIAFDSNSQAFSVASADLANENVLASTTPATVIIGQASATTPTPFPASSLTITPTVGAGTLTPTSGSSTSITPTPSGTNEKICKIRLSSKNKKLQKILKSIRKRLDDIDKDLDKFAVSSVSASFETQQLQGVQDIDKDLSSTQTKVQQVEEKLHISPQDFGGCVGSFDPNNPGLMNNCDQSTGNAATLGNAWQSIVNQLQKFFGK